MEITDFNLYWISQEEAKPEMNPALVVEVDEGDHVRLSLSPLPRGYGVTLGSPLRRARYRGHRGYAVVGVVIDDHELDDAGVLRGTLSRAEDVVMSLRSARIAYLGAANPPPRRGVMRLDVAGPGVIVRLRDLAGQRDFEIVNGDSFVTELSQEVDAGLSASVSFMMGRGYEPAPGAGDPAGGRYLTDGIFSPVVRAEYAVERVRIGSRTDFEKLTVSVWTNGTLGALDAVMQSASSLGNRFEGLRAFAEGHLNLHPSVFRTTMDAEASMRYREPVESLNLGGRALNVLKRSGVDLALDLLDLEREDLFRLRGFGIASYREIANTLRGEGYLEDVGPDSHWTQVDSDADSHRQEEDIDPDSHRMQDEVDSDSHRTQMDVDADSHPTKDDSNLDSHRMQVDSDADYHPTQDDSG